MNILCIGGAGYVGGACLRWLNRHGHRAIAYDNISEGNRGAVGGATLVVGDIQDRAKLAETMASNKIEAVMHFAAAASVPESIKDPEFYWRNNVVGTKNVLDAMRDTGVKRIVFSSTAATYGFDNPMPLVETSVQAPVVPYGTTKLSAEWLIKDYAKAYNFGYGLLRYFNASGADPDGKFGEDRRAESHLIPLTLYVPLGRREKLMIFGGDWPTADGTCVRDFVHTEDLAQAHELCVQSIDPGVGRMYNLGSGTGVTVMQVLKGCERAVGAPIKHEIVPRRSGDPGVLIASPERIKKELGWKPQYERIEQIIDTAWRWHSAHPDGYGERGPRKGATANA